MKVDQEKNKQMADKEAEEKLEEKLDESLEEKLDELLKLEDDTNRKELKKIERGISTRIYRKTAAFVVGGLLFVLALTLLVSQLAYLNIYNPKTWVNFTLENRKDDMDEFGLLMQTFAGMCMPDIYMYVDGDVKKTGFGNYEISAAFGSREDGYKGYSNGNIVIKWEKMYLEPANATPLAYFSYPAPFCWGDKPLDILDNVEELPDSSYLTVSLTFNKEKNIEQIYDFMKAYGESYSYTYLATSAQKDAIPVGLDMGRICGYGIDGDFSGKYPDLYSEPRTDHPLDKEAVANCYHSRIRLLMDNPEFFQMAVTLFGSGKWQQDELNRCLAQELEKNTDEITFVACRGRIKKAEVLRLLESDELSLIRVHKVSLSNFPD